MQLAVTIDQIIDMKLVGIEPGQAKPTLPFKANEYTGFELLEVIDSSLWAVQSDIESVLNVVKQRFHDVREVHSGGAS